MPRVNNSVSKLSYKDAQIFQINKHHRYSGIIEVSLIRDINRQETERELITDVRRCYRNDYLSA